jgi:hypothetical protein
VARARAVAAASTRPEAAAAAAPGRDGPPDDPAVHDADVQEGASR